MSPDQIQSEIARLKRQKREFELMFPMGDAGPEIDAQVEELEERLTFLLDEKSIAEHAALARPNPPRVTWPVRRVA